MPAGSINFVSDAQGNVNQNTSQGHIYVNEAFSIVKNPVRIAISAASGGTQLETIPAAKVFIRNFPANDVMWVGGNSDDAPYQNHGMDLFGGESVTYPVRNANQIQICALTSGQFIRYQVFLNEQDVPLSTNEEPPEPDLIAPTVLSTVPVSGSTGISRSAVITAQFSEIVNSGSLDISTFTVNNGTANCSGSVQRSTTDFTQAKFNPLTQLSGSTLHTCTLTTAISDEADNPNFLAAPYVWTFTTEANPDTTKPTISGRTPLSGATSVAVNTTVTATFSEPMAAATINTTNFTLVNQAAAPVASTVALGADQITATLTPNAVLANNNTHTATVLSGVTDIAANSLLANSAWTFTTVSAVPPTVSSTTPAAGAIDQLITVVPTITFSMAMLSSTITTANITLKDQSANNVAGTVTLSANGLTATFTPNATLSNSVTYTIGVSTGVKNSAGTAMAAAFSSTFTTKAAVLTIIYQVTGGTGGNYLLSTDDIREGMIFPSGSTLIGKKPKKARVQLKKSGSPTGTITVKVRKGTDDSVAATFGAGINASTLTTSYADYDFQDLTSTYALVANDKLAVEFSGGDISNKVAVQRMLSDVDVKANRTHYDTTYHNVTTEDFNATVWE